jgi:hypothetical protein
MNLEAGTRVKILPHAFWPKGGVGTVAVYPESTKEIFGTVDGCYRVFHGGRGPVLFYWVVFDDGILDGETDGPYREAEIMDQYLSPLEK